NVTAGTHGPKAGGSGCLAYGDGVPAAISTTITIGQPLIAPHKSFCRFCHAVCGIEGDVEDGRVVEVRGDREHVVSQGYLCVKGRELAEQHTSPERVPGARKRAPDRE